MSRLIVTGTHLVTIPGHSTSRGFCVPLSRTWFKRQGLDFRDFIRNGIDAEILLATGDGMAIALVEWARTCEGATDGQE